MTLYVCETVYHITDAADVVHLARVARLVKYEPTSPLAPVITGVVCVVFA